MNEHHDEPAKDHPDYRLFQESQKDAKDQGFYIKMLRPQHTNDTKIYALYYCEKEICSSIPVPATIKEPDEPFRFTLDQIKDILCSGCLSSYSLQDPELKLDVDEIKKFMNSGLIII